MAMSTEDILMEAYNEGLLDEVWKILDEEMNIDEWKYREYSDKYSHALSIARERKTKHS